MMLRRIWNRVRASMRRPGEPVVKEDCIIRDSRIGAYAYIGPECRIFGADIGCFVSIGPRVIIGEAEHPTENEFLSNSLLNATEMQAYEAGLRIPTVLEADCWIGAGAILRKGVRIGHGAVVGAGAVVVKDVPPYAIHAGVPARFIRMRLDEDTRARLDASRWWDMPVEKLRERRGQAERTR